MMSDVVMSDLFPAGSFLFVSGRSAFDGFGSPGGREKKRNTLLWLFLFGCFWAIVVWLWINLFFFCIISYCSSFLSRSFPFSVPSTRVAAGL